MKKIDKDALAVVEFDGKDIEFVTVNNLRLPSIMYTQLVNLRGIGSSLPG